MPASGTYQTSAD